MIQPTTSILHTHLYVDYTWNKNTGKQLGRLTRDQIKDKLDGGRLHTPCLQASSSHNVTTTQGLLFHGSPSIRVSEITNDSAAPDSPAKMRCVGAKDKNPNGGVVVNELTATHPGDASIVPYYRRDRKCLGGAGGRHSHQRRSAAMSRTCPRFLPLGNM